MNEKIFSIKGIRTSCFTGAKEEVELNYFISNNWCHLVNGVTGYEGFELSGRYSRFKNINEFIKTGWYACSGTKNKYDTLFIPSIELEKIFKNIEGYEYE